MHRLAVKQLASGLHVAPSVAPYVAMRREFLAAVAGGFAALHGRSLLAEPAPTAPGALAEALALTPRQTEGPFYPDRLPLDTDNDLIVVNDRLDASVGQVTHLAGRVLTPAGEPVRNATVEIWQVDGHGVYLHSADRRAALRDANFQGFGRFLTDSRGRYYFRTIKPVPYPGRCPHIHMAVYRGSSRVLTTQCYVAGEPQNDRDGIYRGLGDAKRLVTVDFKPLAGSTAGELTASLDLVVGLTPEDREGPGPVRPPRRGV